MIWLWFMTLRMVRGWKIKQAGVKPLGFSPFPWGPPGNGSVVRRTRCTAATMGTIRFTGSIQPIQINRIGPGEEGPVYPRNYP